MAHFIIKTNARTLEAIHNNYKQWFMFPHDSEASVGDRVTFLEESYPMPEESKFTPSYQICHTEIIFDDDRNPFAKIVSFGPMHVKDYILQKECE